MVPLTDFIFVGLNDRVDSFFTPPDASETNATYDTPPAQEA